MLVLPPHNPSAVIIRISRVTVEAIVEVRHSIGRDSLILDSFHHIHFSGRTTDRLHSSCGRLDQVDTVGGLAGLAAVGV